MKNVKMVFRKVEKRICIKWKNEFSRMSKGKKYMRNIHGKIMDF